jgi:hypothetical protein
MGLLKFGPSAVAPKIVVAAPPVPRVGLLPAVSPGLLKSLGIVGSEKAYRDRGDGAYRPPVSDSEDLQRILALPRRAPPSQEAQEVLADKWTAILRYDNPNCRCAELRPGMKDPCIRRLHGIQGWYFEEAYLVGGVLGHLAVGAGKTGIDILLPMVLPGCKRAIVMIPPGLRTEFNRAFVEWSQHFKVPNLAGSSGPFYADRPVIELLPYSWISIPSRRQALMQSAASVPIGGLIVICDEFDQLGNRASVRTGRFLRFIESRIDTRTCGHTGTMTDSGLDNYCVDPSTRILKADLTWVPAGSVQVDDELIGFDEGLGESVKMRPSRVEATAMLRAPRVRIVTDHGSVICSTNHRWVLQAREVLSRKRGDVGRRYLLRMVRRWIPASEVCVGDRLSRACDPWETDQSREGGYIAGLLDGEACVSGRRVVFAQNSGAVLNLYCDILRSRGFSPLINGRRGSDVKAVFAGGAFSHPKLLGMFRPTRLLPKGGQTWNGIRPWGHHTKPAVVLAVEPLPDGEVVAIQTSTRTFFAEGLLSHNCHLSAVTLRDGSPVPVEPSEILAWASALDPLKDGSYRTPVGALRKLCIDGEPVRSGFRRRLVETPGVVTTADAHLPIRLTLTRRQLVMSPRVVEALDSVRAGIRPDWMGPESGLHLAPGEGEELTEALDVATCASQVACGFFYRWKFPHGEPETLIKEWFTRRQSWNREVREMLKYRSDNLDSPKLLRDAAERYLRGDPNAPETPTWHSQAFRPWQEIENEVYHEQETIWLDDFMANDAIAWAAASPGIVWFDHVALGHRIADLGGLPYFGEGKKAEEEIEKERGDRSIAASISAHHRGRNLQGAFARNLVANPPSSGKLWGQLLGRTHRYGQKADVVMCDVYLHCGEFRGAYGQAMRRVEYTYQTTGETNRLLFAEKIDMPEIKPAEV